MIRPPAGTARLHWIGVAWDLVRKTVSGFIADEGLSRGAAIAFYTIFSIVPIMAIIMDIVGVVYGPDTTQGAVADQLRGLIGQENADAVQAMIAAAHRRPAGLMARVVSVVMLLITATGVFGEMQTALNVIWKAGSPLEDLSARRLLHQRVASLGLVGALAFVLMVSLTLNAAVSAVMKRIEWIVADIAILVQILNLILTFGLVTLLFAAIYKILPDTPIAWRDVWTGAIATAAMFMVGEALIGFYISHAVSAASYGAAGALIVVILWVYYSAQIFLIGAEFTRAFAARRKTAA
ncbi:YihY/virulence factor BrkB family protein [Gluconacetobacter tumulisoli]|uniref:YihY/virulence factor BrkB family protein n=1 Tax=Gluconacetobacter tumulisoli TaxID=1286189 RepID=A0A7W4PMG6_9PROT|nr:YihY/virulence factor BrkB family protein [Gluconacetobacter tumulisoli]MBB2202958.1 YihY/virulence factor BrkB family protein [Gluconacetobacter tumulisoli]